MNEKTAGDQDLLRAMQDGSEEAFVALYRRWQGPVYRFALRMSGSRAAAEDATQEVFMALIRDCNSYSAARGSLSAWLYGIARHVILRRLEREKDSPVRVSDSERDAQVGKLRSPYGDPHDETVRRQETGRLRNAVLSLPVHYREVVVLCELQEVNYAEAAKVLGCSVGTVRSRLHRARSILAERLRCGFEKARPLAKVAPNGCVL